MVIKKDQNSSASERRQFIAETIRTTRDSLPFSNVLENFPNVSEQTLNNDAKVLQKDGHPINVFGKSFIFDLKHSDALVARRPTEVRRKKTIGKLVAQVIVEGLATCKSTDLASKLRGLHLKSHRVVALDAGSTCEQIAASLLEQKAFVRHLASLCVLTNSPELSRILRRGRHGTILIGGNLRRETDATCGVLARRSLEALDVYPEIGVVGASGCSHEYLFTCNNEDEADIKSQLLARSRIRCVAMDSTKLFGAGLQNGAWPFASLEHVDILFTDSLKDYSQNKIANLLREAELANTTIVESENYEASI